MQGSKQADKDMSEALKATHEGELRIGGKILPCAVLDDGTRILTATAIFRAFDRPRKGKSSESYRADLMPSFINANNLQPFVDEELREWTELISYKTISGVVKTGYNARILRGLCRVYMEARKAGVLQASQERLAVISEALLYALSDLGITALVDEATGYQYEREHDALQELLKAFIAEELQPWQKTFPDAFYQHIFRLNHWDYTLKGVKQRPQIIGKWTNAYIYEQLPDGVLQALKERTRSKSARYHQSLTPELGHPTLEKQIARVTAIMSISQTWEDFQGKYNQMVSQTPRSEDFAGKLIYKAKDKPKDLREGYDYLFFDDETID